MKPPPSDSAPAPTTQEQAHPSDKKLRFLLSLRPGETWWPEFKARMIQAARETGMLKDEEN